VSRKTDVFPEHVSCVYREVFLMAEFVWLWEGLARVDFM